MISRDPEKGCFITFEGVEGTGKSTHVHLLEKQLLKEGYTVTRTREPGGTPLGEQVRDLVLRLHHPGPEAELFLMLAARADHVHQVLIPNLNQGRVVLCDRYSHATLAYQGGGRGLDLKEVRGADALATGGLVPDFTLLLDAPSRELADRLRNRASRGALDRIDQEADAFFSRVRSAYFALAETNDRMAVVQSNRDRASVARDIWSVVQPLVEQRRAGGTLL